MKLALTLQALVDLHGVRFRMESEQAQGISYIPDGGYFKDLGLVTYDGIEYYAAVYSPPSREDE